MNSFGRSCRKSLIAVCRKLKWAILESGKRPRAAVAVLFITTAILTTGLHKLTFLFSAEDMVGEGIPSADELSSIKDRYEEGASTFLYLIPPAGKFSYTLDEFCSIRHWYSLFRIIHPEIKSAISTFDLKKPNLQNGAWKYENVFPIDCEHLFSPKSFEQVKTELNETPWLGFRDEENRLSLSFSFTYSDSEQTKYGSFDPQMVQAVRDSVEKELLPLIPGSQTHWVGSADYQWYVLQGYRFSVIVNLAMLGILILGLRLFYGTWASGIIFSLTLVFNGIWIYGLKAWAGSPYDLLTSGLFTAIAISALEDFTFISAEQVKGSSWRHAIRKLAIPSAFTSLTTVIGFLSLLVSNLAMIRRFGLWCAIGAVQEWVMIFIFLPGLLSQFYKKERWVTSARTKVESWSERISAKKIPRWLTVASLLVFPLSIFCFSHLSANDTPEGIFPKSHVYRSSLIEMRHSKGWQSTVSLLIEPGETNEDLEAILEKLKTVKGTDTLIGGVETSSRVVDWLSKEVPKSREQVALDFEGSEGYRKLVDPDGIPRAVLYLKKSSVEDLQELEADIKTVCPNHECHAGGDLIAYSDFSTQIPHTLMNSMVLSLILVGAVIAYLAIAFGKQKIVVDLLLSSFWGPCTMLLIIVALHVPMNFMKCIFAGVLVGLTGDNAIQYLFGAKRGELEKGILKRGNASLQTTLIMMVVSMAYLFSYFSPPKEFGLILATGLGVSLVGDLWLLSGFIRRHRRP